MSEQEQQEFAELLAIYRRRLHELRKQEATFGSRTPPEITTEIEKIEATLKSLAPLARGQVSSDFIADLRRFGRPTQVSSIAGLWVVQVAMLILLVAIAGRLLPC